MEGQIWPPAWGAAPRGIRIAVVAAQGWYWVVGRIPNADEVLDLYEKHLRLRGLAKGTRVSYRRAAAVFMADLQRRHGLFWLKQIRESGRYYLRDHVGSRAEQVKAQSAQVELVALRHFFAFLQEAELIEKNPAEGVRGPKGTRKLPDFLTQEECEDLLEVARQSNYRVRARNVALVDLLWASGARVSEISQARVRDIRMGERIFEIRNGKGGKDRFVPFAEETKESLKLWLKDRDSILEREGRKSNRLFISRRGNELPRGRIWEILKNLSKKTETRKRGSPHVLRHSYATHLTNAGADIRTVQELLGHKNLSSTVRYTHVNIAELKRIYKAAHPRAELPLDNPCKPLAKEDEGLPNPEESSKRDRRELDS